MSVLSAILITLSAFVFMEFVAWFTHKYVMHGPLWMLHKDHHTKESKGWFEHNDFFFLIFALPGIAALLFGMQGGYNFLFWIGLGITIYGFSYFFVHDILIHRRLRILDRPNNTYLKAIRKAHVVHHKQLKKEGGECFGLLWMPYKYYVEQKG